MMGLLKKSLCLFWTLLLVFFVDAGEQDVGSPLRVAQCRATCLQKVSRRWFFCGGRRIVDGFKDRLELTFLSS